MLNAFLLAAAAQGVTLSAKNYRINEPMPVHTGELMWSDEFDGPKLDMSKWSFDTSRVKAGWYNGELQIMNLAMGGDWAAAKGIDDAALPQRFGVDYVRVWGMPDKQPAPSQ